MNRNTAKGENKKNKYGQYFTPDFVADFMVSLADVHTEAKILEPCCGEGVFLEALQNKGFQNITAYEIDHNLATEYDFVKYESFVSAKMERKHDLIIGNPPYIRWKNLEVELKEELATNPLWVQHFNSLCDYLYIFILKSIESLEENGQLIFICPEYWMNTTHSIGLRNYMVEHGYFEKIYHFNETPIFNKARVSVVIFKYVKSQKAKHTHIEVTKYYKNKPLNLAILAAIKNGVPQNSDIKHFFVKQFELNKRWLLIPEVEVLELQKFEEICVDSAAKKYPTIGDICEIGNGMVSGLDKAFRLQKGQIFNKIEKKHIIEVIKAAHLQPFAYTQTTKYIFVNELKKEGKLKEDFPNFYEKLQPYTEKLIQRYQYNRKIDYWQWVFLRNYKLFSSDQARIFVPGKERISNKDYFRFAYVERGIFPTQDVTALFLKEDTKESIYYVLAFLNNRRVFNWLKNKGIVKGSIVEFSEKPIASIPFKRINWADTSEVKIH
ncbi:MAG: Eco57I restriction-modification methylase domain-containing protein, partial [Chitinophagales bacterium]